MTTISEAIRQVRAEYIDAGKAASAAEINAGLCEEFAQDVAIRVKGAYLVGVEEFQMGLDGDPTENDVFDWDLLRTHWKVGPPGDLTEQQANQLGIGWHVWIVLNGAHSDAECPEGTRSFFDLPCLARQITTALS